MLTAHWMLNNYTYYNFMYRASPVLLQWKKINVKLFKMHSLPVAEIQVFLSNPGCNQFSAKYVQQNWKIFSQVIKYLARPLLFFLFGQRRTWSNSHKILSAEFGRHTGKKFMLDLISFIQIIRVVIYTCTHSTSDTTDKYARGSNTK